MSSVKYPLRDWKEAVATGFTVVGYSEWVAEQEKSDSVVSTTSPSSLARTPPARGQVADPTAPKPV